MIADQRTASRVAGGITSEVIRSWPTERSFSVDAVLREHPDLIDRRSAVLDLAYEEFCRLEESGTSVPTSVFAGRYPRIERSLRRVLELHHLCCDSPDVADVLLGERWPVVGEELVGFCIVEELGRGAASRVFLAREVELADRRVVVKVGRGQQEAAALGTLDHPNIVPVLSARTDPATGLTVLCMPDLGRATLDVVIDQLFAGGPPASGEQFVAAFSAAAQCPTYDDPRSVQRTFPETVAAIGAALAAGLAHAHSRGVVHSDVKPSNVLVTPRGVPMLLDFNLAHRHGRDEWSNRGGTLPYMSPEQLASWRRADPITFASDVFSLGVTLRELLTGRLPFGPLELRDIVAAEARLAEHHRNGPEPVPAELRVRHPRLVALIDSCLADAPEDRPTADSLAIEFAAVTDRAMDIVLGRRRLLALLAAGAGAVATGTIVTWRAVGAAQPWSQGLAAADEGRFADAARYFDLVLARRPSDVPALVARGWCRLRAGDLKLAYVDLREASQRHSSGQCAALHGYAAVLSMQDRLLAREKFDEAIERGYETAAVRSNLGYCFRRLNNAEESVFHLRQALRLDPSCGFAHHNLAILDLRLAAVERRPPDLSHVESALATAPPSAGLFVDAADVFAAACAQGVDREEQVVACCRSAVAHGADPIECLELVAGRYPAAREFAGLQELSHRQRRVPPVSTAELQTASVAPLIVNLREFLSRL